MGIDKKILKVWGKIYEEEAEYKRLEANKQNAGTLGEEKAALLEMEKKRAYIEGMRAALKVIEE